jgi:epoxyqueuosine reductase
MTFSSALLKEKAGELGFNFAGVIPLETAPTLHNYLQWVEKEMHGKMGYMAREDRQLRRRDPTIILPGARTMLLVGLDYRVKAFSEVQLEDPSRGRIAAYAWGLDYHLVMTTRLESLAQWLKDDAGLANHRVYVDTGAILERAHGQQAGLGFVGKNTMLIHPRRGSYFFLGEILLDLEFDDYDEPAPASMCGTCTRCLVACPTNAFPKPYVLDARRCISYHTIELKSSIPHAFREAIGNWVFGCDICQDVCPWQRFVIPTTEQTLTTEDIDRAAPPLLDLLALDDSTFQSKYEGTPIYRIKRDRLVRNACIAAGNWGEEVLLPHLSRLLTDRSPLVRSHAAWAFYKISGQTSRGILERLLERESDEAVRRDILTTLEMPIQNLT